MVNTQGEDQDSHRCVTDDRKWLRCFGCPARSQVKARNDCRPDYDCWITTPCIKKHKRVKSTFLEEQSRQYHEYISHHPVEHFQLDDEDDDELHPTDLTAIPSAVTPATLVCGECCAPDSETELKIWSKMEVDETLPVKTEKKPDGETQTAIPTKPPSPTSMPSALPISQPVAPGMIPVGLQPDPPSLEPPYAAGDPSCDDPMGVREDVKEDPPPDTPTDHEDTHESPSKKALSRPPSPAADDTPVPAAPVLPAPVAPVPPVPAAHIPTVPTAPVPALPAAKAAMSLVERIANDTKSIASMRSDDASSQCSALSDLSVAKQIFNTQMKRIGGV